MQHAAGQGTNRGVAGLKVARACRRQRVVLAWTAGAAGLRLTYSAHDETTFLKPAEGRVDGTRRHQPAAALFDMGADRAAVGVVTKRGDREEDQLFEFAE